MRSSVDQADRREGRLVNGAPGERDERVLVRGRAVESLEGGCGRAPADGRADDVSARDGEVARRISHSVALLEGDVLLLVHDDEPQLWKRGEHGEPSAEHNVGEATVRQKPAAGALQPGTRTGLRDDASAR